MTTRYQDDPIIPTDLIAAISLAGWAFVLSRPVHTFAASRSWDGMAGLAGENTWALAAAAVCGLYVFGVLLGGWWRLAATVLAALWYWLVGGSFAASNLESTGTYTYLAIALGLTLAGARAWVRVLPVRRRPPDG